MTSLIAVLDRRPLVRDGLVAALTAAGLDAVGVDGLAELDAVCPDVVVVDAPDSADDAVRALDGAALAARVVVAHRGPDAHAVLRGRSVRLVAAAGGLGSVVAAVVEHGRKVRLRWQPASIGPVALSAREASILRAVSSGATSKETGERLGISTRTVENHKRRIFLKLGARNQAQAVAVAARAGMLPVAVGDRR